MLGVPAETRAIKKTLNPCWDQEFRFRVNPSARQCLLFEVYDYNKLTSDDFLGQFRYKLYQLPVNNAPVDFQAAPVHEMKLVQRSARSRVRGHLHCQFMYSPLPGAVGPSTQEPLAEETELNDEQWMSVQNVQEQDQSPLPEGWEEREDFSGRIVYVNHINRTVSLDRPTEPAVMQRDRPRLAQSQLSLVVVSTNL